MTTTTDRPRGSGPRVAQRGPPLGVLALASTGLFVASLVLGLVLAGGESFPSPFGPVETILGYVAAQATALQVAGTLQFASAVPLAIYAATAHARLGQLGIRAPGAAIALAGGVLASAFLMFSALLQWSLSRPGTTASEPVVRALHDLAFLTGGPAAVVALGLLVAGVAVSGLLAGLLPHPMAWTGLAIALVAELSTLVLLLPGVGVLLPLGPVLRPDLARRRRCPAAAPPPRPRSRGERPMIEKMVQYTHLDKLYAHLPGIAEAQPSIFGIDADRYAELRDGFDTRARRAAEDLLADDGFAARVDALPFRPGETVLAVGDSITDDLQSWAEILRHLLHLHRPGHRVRMVNAGLTAHTTAMSLSRFPAALAGRPDRILCLLGSNDVSRVGAEPITPLVGPDETVKNLRALRRMAGLEVPWTWITPTPVHEGRVAEFALFRFTRTTWRNTDISALTTAIHGLDDPVVDLGDAFGDPADPELLGPDGVHPSLAGQAAIARAVVEHLTGARTGTERSHASS